MRESSNRLATRMRLESPASPVVVLPIRGNRGSRRPATVRRPTHEKELWIETCRFPLPLQDGKQSCFADRVESALPWALARSAHWTHREPTSRNASRPTSGRIMRPHKSLLAFRHKTLQIFPCCHRPRYLSLLTLPVFYLGDLPGHFFLTHFLVETGFSARIFGLPYQHLGGTNLIVGELLEHLWTDIV